MSKSKKTVHDQKYIQRAIDALVRDGKVTKVVVCGEVRYVATQFLRQAIQSGAVPC